MIGRRASARAGNLSLVAAAVAVLLGPVSPVAAQDITPVTAAPPARQRIVLFAPTGEDPLSERIGAELTSLGFEVSRETIPPAAVIEETVHRALVAGARAAVIADGTRTEVWIAQDKSDHLAFRQELEIEDMHGLESVLALRTVELMRVSLGLVGPVNPSAPSAPSAPSSAEAGAPRLSVVVAGQGTDDRFSITVSSGALLSTGRLGPFALVGAGLAARLRGWLGVELRGYVPVGDQSVSDVAGEVHGSIWLIGGGVMVMSSGAGRVAVEGGAGMMAAVLHTVGTGIAPDTGSTDDALGVVVYGRGAARIRITPRWSVRVELLGGTALRRPTIAVSTGGALDHDITTWGKAFAAGLVGAELRF